ncbi:MAG: agmatine deiminase family protein [Bacteroidales bacterium]|jgi:agmatine/peptidylarginine deiminase|nr:agmatine deiminase family protein [Bacteroidales bacterium]
MKIISLLFFTFFLSVAALFAQPIYNEAGIRLYKNGSEEEREWAVKNRLVDNRTVPTPPPSGELRPIAEYEPAEAVLIRYPFGIPMSLIKEMAKDVTVITIVSSNSQQSTVLGQYNSNGVNIANCKFLIAPSNTHWTRDYGPWFMAIDNNEVGMFDFTYDRTYTHGRINDNKINEALANYLTANGTNINRYACSLLLTGGNHMNDGDTQAAATDYVLEENPTYTALQLNQLFSDYIGTQNYYFLDDPLQEYIKHIDCWGKFLTPTKVLIGKVPTSDPRYYLYELTASFFATLASPWGIPYEVFRVNTPGNYATTPYTNSLILNNRVFVPVNQTTNANDNAALQVYKDAMPGYEVIGINYNNWENTDALHCRVHEIADRCMLYIKHQPYFAEVENTGIMNFNTEIYSYCNNTIISDSVLVYLKVNGDNFQGYKMAYSGDNKWEVSITDLPDGIVEYYIFAKDESDRRESHPYIARYAPNADPHKFELKSETPPPPEPLLVLSKKESSVFSDKLMVVEDYIRVYNKGNADLTIDIQDIDFPNMLTISPQNGTIPESDSLSITFTYNFNNIAKLVEYLGSCKLKSNDPKNEEVDIFLKAVLDLVGIKDMEYGKIVIYPNPTTGELRITNYELQIGEIVIYDIYGRKQKSRKAEKQNAERELVMDVSSLPTGIYFIKIEASFYKFVKL